MFEMVRKQTQNTNWKTENTKHKTEPLSAISEPSYRSNCKTYFCTLGKSFGCNPMPSKEKTNKWEILVESQAITQSINQSSKQARKQAS